MNSRLLNAVALVAILTAGSAFAADAPVPTTTPAPALTSTAPAATPAENPKPTMGTNIALPSSKPGMASKTPAIHPRHVSACSMSVRKAEKVLASSKMPAEKIATAWQHLDAAKQARKSHQAKACETESQMAATMLKGKI